jgi:ATP-dependent DNA helicase PIF1
MLTSLAFANMLNEMRLGKLTPKSIEAFRALNRQLGSTDDFEATEL